MSFTEATYTNVMVITDWEGSGEDHTDFES